MNTSQRFFSFILITLSFTVVSSRAQTPFSGDSAASYLKTLSVEIGPRPMGSPNERRAMEFGVRKFKEFGLQEAYIMPMMSVESDMVGTSTNTRSGIAIGVLKGETGRIMVIGGHVDSAGPEIPGANDDGSGSASVIELARVLSKRKNTSTLVFCLFGGEEQGLRGSKYFVEHFQQLKNVGLMFQVDMTNGSHWLVPLIDNKGTSAPSWLVRAAFDEYSSLGYSGLYYPTHFLTFNNSILPGGGIGSDHMPFLQKNIPAIDFTSDINDPIHTPQDNFALFNQAGLKRSGDLVYRLVEKFDGGVPKPRTDEYYFWHLGNVLFFVPLWALTVFVVLAIGAALWSLIRLRSRRIDTDKASRPKIPGLKLFLLMLIIQTFVWSSELFVGFLKGARYPWYSAVSGYFLLSGLGGLIGIWLCLQIIPKLNLSTDAYRYQLRSGILLSVFLALLSLASVKAALYPASALLLLSLAVLAPKPWLKLILWALSPYLMYRFVINEGFPLFARTFPEATMTSGLGFSLMWNLFLIFFFSLWAFPFLTGLVSITLDARVDFLWISNFKLWPGIVLAGLGFLVCAAWLVGQQSYSDHWKQTVRVDQLFDMNTGKGSIYLRSGEYLRGTRLRYETSDTLISSWSREVKVKELASLQDLWITADRKIGSATDTSGTKLNILSTLRFKYAPYSVQLTYSSRKNPLRAPTSVLASTTTSRSISFKWYSFSDTLLLVPLECTVAKNDSLSEFIEAVFTQPLVPVEATKPFTNSATRSTIRIRTDIRTQSQ